MILEAMKDICDQAYGTTTRMSREQSEINNPTPLYCDGRNDIVLPNIGQS